MSAPSRLPSAAAGGRRRLDRTQRRESIIAAAASAFAVGGYAATSMADLARAAGVSHLIVYRHFESKDVLYDTVLCRAGEQLEDSLSDDAAIGSYGPAPAALLAAARAHANGFTALWRHAAREPAFRHHADHARDQLEAATRRALAAIVPVEHVRWAARATSAYLLEAVLIWIEDADEALDARFLAATEAALRAGVRSWAKPASDREGEPD